MTESDKHFASILLLHLPAMVSAATNCAGVRLCVSVEKCNRPRGSQWVLTALVAMASTEETNLFVWRTRPTVEKWEQLKLNEIMSQAKNCFYLVKIMQTMKAHIKFYVPCTRCSSDPVVLQFYINIRFRFKYLSHKSCPFRLITVFILHKKKKRKAQRKRKPMGDTWCALRSNRCGDRSHFQRHIMFYLSFLSTAMVSGIRTWLEHFAIHTIWALASLFRLHISADCVTSQ